jgi:hypothetical protein
MDGLRRDTEDKVNDVGYDSNCIIKFADIMIAVSKLKPGKHDGHFGLSSDHVINACDELFIHIAMLMSALVVQGYVTDYSTFSTCCPYPRVKV